MKNYARNAAVALFAGAALSAGALAPASAAPVITGGLVNVTVVDVIDGGVLNENQVGVGVAANVVAQVCGVTVPVAVLARQVIAQGGEFTCDSVLAPDQRLVLSR